MVQQHYPTPKILRLPQVKAITTLPRSTLLAEVKAGRFPPPFKLTTKSIAWLSSDIDAFIARRSGRNSQEGI